MRDIVFDDAHKTLPADTFVLYGDTGSGKTTWSAGMPRPVFLCPTAEGGWNSLEGLRDELFEPDVPPLIWGLSEMTDMAAAIERVRPLIATKRVLTIVVSSMTFYADMYLAHLARMHGASDMRKIYGDLGIHLRDTRTTLHSLGVNVVWEAQASAPEKTDVGDFLPGRPSVPGKEADKLAASVSYLFRSKYEERKEKGQVVERTFKMLTSQGGSFLTRSRIAQGQPQLPSALTGGYPEFLEARGYNVDELRGRLPPIKAAVSPAKTVVATPPIINKPTVAVTTPRSTASATNPSNGK